MHEEGRQCYEKDKDDFGYLIWRIMKLWQRSTQQALDEFHTTTSQLEILGCVYHLNDQNPNDEVTQAQLSALADIDPMTTSTILRNLEKKGYVIRKQSLSDTRARNVFLTNEGKDLLEQAFYKVKNKHAFLLEAVNFLPIKKELEKLLFALEEANNLKVTK